MFLNLQWYILKTDVKLHFVVFYIVTALQYKPNRNLLPIVIGPNLGTSFPNLIPGSFTLFLYDSEKIL